MNRRIFTGAMAEFICLPKLPAQDSSDWPGRRDAVLAVYQDALNLRCACCTDKLSFFAIDTLTATPPLPRVIAAGDVPAMFSAPQPSYLAPPPEQRRDAEELVQNLAHQSAEPPQHIDSRLRLASPYRLITAAERRELNIFHSQAQIISKESLKTERSVPRAFRKRFEHAGDLWSLSPVGFNNAHTLAGFHFQSSGGGCYEEHWYVMAKQSSGWKVQPWNSTRMDVCT